MSGKGWFSSAISGLESRLDTILAEDDQASAKSRAADAAAKHEGTEKATGEAKLALPVEPVSRNPSRSRPSSRLQDRLAKAVNKGTERAESRPSSDLGSRPDSPALRIPAVTAVSDMGRSSIESKRSDIEAATNVQETTISVPPSSDEIAVLAQAIQLENNRVVPPSTTEAIDTALPNATALLSSDEAAPVHPPSVQLPVARIPPAPSSRQSLDVLPSPSSVDTSAPTKPADLSHREPHDIQADLTLLQMTYETALRENRDEVNAHLERIDALQSKLAYLSQQLAMSSKEAASDSDASATSRKLADKDIQIAALLEEGQKLSKNEMKQSGLLKKLRSRVQEQDKEIVTLKQSLAIVEREFTQQQDKVKHLEATEKSAQEKLKIIGQIERDIATIKAEREEAGKTITELRGKLTDAQSRGDEAEKKAQSGALEAEKGTTLSLREDLENLRIEKKLAEERAKRELQASRDENKTQRDRARVLEFELRGEITNLESNLELLRSRTEEATSSTKGDSQTTLLRQIETLQTQYSLASDNWQGIETSLTSRVAALEKERDDMAKRESDIRRKARETNSKARRLEEDLENATERVGSLEDDIKAQRVAAQKLREKLVETEKAAQDARSDSEKARGLWETELQQRIEEEKIRWKSDLQTETLNAEFNHSRPDSLSTTHRRHSPDPLGLQNKRLPRPISSASDLPLSPMDRMFDEQARRPSGSRQKPTTRVRTPDIGTSNRQDSISSSMVNVNGGGMPETPSIFTIDHDDPFDNISSPQRTINDMISVSTVGAGPSVQLVERMSAAVRRLESEKATSKEEMIRLSAQRDDAREEVVTLMREIEQTRSQAQKVEALELQLEEMNERYQTTLEMLGEKTERVEELEGDVDDLKKMYRELVQTMK